MLDCTGSVDDNLSLMSVQMLLLKILHILVTQLKDCTTWMAELYIMLFKWITR